MRVRGKIAPGVSRGELLIRKFFFRIKAILGFEPYKGTLDVRLERKVKIEDYATKAIDHILVDGTRMVEAHLAPVVLHVRKGGEVNDHECWAIRPVPYTHGEETVEIINRERLREKFSLKDGDDVEVTFFEPERKKDSPAIGLMRKLYRREHRLSV